MHAIERYTSRDTPARVAIKMPAGEAFVLTAEHERQYRTDGYTVGPRARELQDPRACA